jgi:SH3-like domain-containing protein
MNIMLFLITVFTILLFPAGSVNALCVNVPEANLRSGPGTKYKKTWEVFKYMPFKKINRKGNWYRVKDVDDDAHWIYRKLVTDKYDCAVVKVGEANIRSGPGTKYEKKASSPALRYDAFRVLSRKGGWVKVVDEFGDRGWIFRKLLWIY